MSTISRQIKAEIFKLIIRRGQLKAILVLPLIPLAAKKKAIIDCLSYCGHSCCMQGY